MYTGFVVLALIILFPDDTSSKFIGYADIPDEIKTGDPSDKHGGIKMGISSDNCDNAKDFIDVDWNNSRIEYTCYGKTIVPDNEIKSKQIIDRKENKPRHICLPTPIHYNESIPTSGSHRPLWPMYGEYIYLPPQRWVHSLEHGAAVFLYHPCVDKAQMTYFKDIAFNCLKKIIITPYRNLSMEQPFVVVTYRGKLMMNSVQKDVIERFIQKNVWQRSEEKDVWKDGKFSAGLIKSSYKNTQLENNYKVICSRRESKF